MNGWEIKENRENTSTRSEIVVGRDIEFLGNRESSTAKEIHNKSMNGVVFGDGQEFFTNVSITEAKDLKNDLRESYSGEMVEFDRGNGGSNVSNVRGSRARIIGHRSDEYVNRKGREGRWVSKSLPSSTIDIKWPIGGDGYRTMASSMAAPGLS
uniref:Uncharacterized protein n=1 Tax=Salix viminalis TaxID=40686 RepID=A0A6N2N8Y1_SALVM